MQLEFSEKEERCLLMQEIHKIFFKECLNQELITQEQLIYIEI